jgi:hypothetical protein
MNGVDPNQGFAVEDKVEHHLFASWLQAGHTLLTFLQKVNLAAKETIKSYLQYICSRRAHNAILCGWFTNLSGQLC